jgi:SAM-dependent methyltransferase
MTEQAVSPKAQDVPPQAALMQMMTGYWVSQGIYVAARLGLADLLADGPRTSRELAAATGTHAESLYRVLRMLASVGIFAEDAAGRFGLTPLAEPLRSGPGSMRSMAIHMLEGPSWQAWGALLESVQTGRTGFVLANGEEVFPYYAAHPESARPFNEAMTEFSASLSAAVIAAYDFSAFKQIVDVGGGHGGLLTTILKANPQARGVVFDQPEVVAGAPAVIAAQGLQDRAEAVGGDFFEAVPAGGDAYVLKHIIHDWDDERSIAILRNIRRAMADGGRLLLIESVVPAGNAPDFGKLMDVHMLVMTGGRERTEAEHAALFEQAGFRLSRVVPTQSPVSVVEAVKA